MIDEYKKQIAEHKAEIAKLLKVIQKMQHNNQNLNKRDEQEYECKCDAPGLHRNTSSKGGNTKLCYNCLGWK